MTSGALCSDHVNYLILRYLQEAGHENAATAFWRDWHRLPEYKDPENYPFAPVVRRGELVNVIQDGLHHDELVAKLKRNERRFQFTVTTTREVLERRDGGTAENGTMGSRPGSSSKKKVTRPMGIRPPDDFPTPAPKRVKRSEGSEGAHINGDAMEVDAASGSPDADHEDEDEPVSPGHGEEVEIVEVPERYDSMDAAVQTTTQAGPATSTMYWNIDKPGATVYHSAFSPAIKAESNGTNTLLTVGESLCRFYQIPDEMEGSKKILSVDDPTLPPHAIVTAAAWSPDGTTAVCAIDSFRELPSGKQESQQTLITHSHKTGASTQYAFPPLLEPGAIVLALRYRTKLLVVRTNGKRGLVLVYNPGSSATEPVAWRIFESLVLDACWISDDKFVVCGDNGLVEAYRVLPDSSLPVSGFTAATISNWCLENLDWRPPKAAKWDKVRYDEAAEAAGAVVFASTEERRLIMHPEAAGVHGGDWASTDMPGQLTALAFRSRSLTLIDYGSPPVLAATFEDGACVLYALQRSHENGWSHSIDCLTTMHTSSGPALALAWTPDGSHLAVGGTELINIWEKGSLVQHNPDTRLLEQKPDSQLQPLVTWRPDSSAIGTRNGEHESETPLTEPSLSWSSDGESLAFAVDKQIAVIRFQASLSKGQYEDDGEAVNGVHR